MLKVELKNEKNKQLEFLWLIIIIILSKPDPDYLEFLKLIAKPARNLPCAEIQDAGESGQ